MTAPHTPGPWLLASRPTLGGGWPVVAPRSDGRHICRVTYVQHSPIDPKVPGDDAFNRQSRANGLLIAAAPELLESVSELKELFRFALLSTSPEIAKEGMAFIRKAEATLAKALGSAGEAEVSPQSAAEVHDQ